MKISHPRLFVGASPPLRNCDCRLGWISTVTSFSPPDSFTFLNDTKKLVASDGWNNSEWPKLWLYNLHYFDWLRQDGLTKIDAAQSIESWLDNNTPGKGNGWEPYTLSLRIVNWIKWQLAGNQLEQRALDSLTCQVHFLSKSLEYHLLGNHLLANAKALIFAGLFFDGEQAKKWLEKGLHIYRRQLPEQILNDGGHFELSPMYHSIVLEDLLDVYNIVQTYHQDISKLKLQNYIIQMFTWLHCMVHPDKQIALFNDSAFNIAPTLEQLSEYAESLHISLSVPLLQNILLKDSGYGRLQHDELTLIADVGRPGPDYQPGHVHADTLSFELSCGEHRIVVDTGTSTYGINPIRLRERQTAAHNTIEIGGKNSSEVWSAHRLARRADVFDVNFESGDNSSVLSASHNGYAGILHNRKWTLDKEQLNIVDKVKGEGTQQVVTFLHLAPEIKVETFDKNSYVLSVAGKNDTQIKITLDPCMSCRIDCYDYASEFGKTTQANVIIGEIKAELPISLYTTIKRL
jgi:uncharacterized heparinase superfamily protein